jgi:hypothetical protein
MQKVSAPAPPYLLVGSASLAVTVSRNNPKCVECRMSNDPQCVECRMWVPGVSNILMMPLAAAGTNEKVSEKDENQGEGRAIARTVAACSSGTL